MKKITLIALFISFWGYGQFFENQSSEEEENSQSAAFQQEHNPYAEPDQGVDSIGNPGDEVPIDNWIFLLPAVGLALGAFYLIRNRKLA